MPPGATISRRRLGSRARASAGTLTWTAATIATGWALLALGEAVDWSDPTGWIRTAPLDVALAALGRMAGLLLVGWILVSSSAYAVARLAGARPEAIDWLSIRPIRRVVDAFLAGSLVVSTAMPAVAAGIQVDHPPPVTSEEITPDEVSPAYVPVPAGRPRRHQHPPEVAPASEAVPDETDAETGREPPEGPSTVVVRPGDHLWALAETHLRARLTHTPSESEVAAYWASMVTANQDRLQSGDPDLIHPGEEILLPELPLRPRS